MAKWREVKLGEIAYVNMGQSPKSEFFNQTGEGMKFLQGNRTFGRMFPSYDTYTTDITKTADDGDILFTVRAPVGNINLASTKVCIGRGIASIRSKQNQMFLFYYLKCNVDLIRSAENGTTYSSVNRKDLEQFKLYIPDLPTQEKIAKMLFTYDRLIENNNRRIKLLEKSAEELYKEWFVRMRFPGHENVKLLNGIPEGWEIRLYGSFGKVETGKTPSTLISANYGGNIPFIKTPDMHSQTFCINTEESLSELGHSTQPKKLIPKNCICVSCIGTAGIVSITSIPSHTNQQINSLIPLDYKMVPWLYYMTKSLKEMIELFGSTGATMSNLSKGKLEKLKVLTPSNNLVLQYSNIVEPILEKVHSLSKQNQNLIEQRDLLLPRLMGGKMEV